MIKGLYTAPPGAPILRGVAHALARETQGDMDLARQAFILLPTRRALRILEENLLEAFGTPTVLLPKLMTIGDIELPDEENEGKPPPRPIGGVERLYSLIPFIEAEGFAKNGFEANWRMAQDIVKLIDLLQTEELGPEALDKIPYDQQAQHWQDSGGLFRTIAQKWLAHLKDTKRVNIAEARSLRIDRLIKGWRKKMPEHHVWLVGSTGSILAVRRLMHAVLDLPQGAVLLPGLDKEMDDAAWEILPEAHPQALLKSTLTTLGYDRREVRLWPESLTSEEKTKRAAWLSQALSPLPQQNISAADNIAILTAGTLQEEVEAIAHLCAVELRTNPASTIVVVSNETSLPQRLAGILCLYGIDADASAGIPLSDTSLGMALSSFIRFLCPNVALADVWAALKHPQFAPLWPWAERQETLAAVEDILRDPLRCPGAIEDVLPLLDPAFAKEAAMLRNEARKARSLPEWAAFLRLHSPAFVKAGSVTGKLAAEAVERALDELAASRLPRPLPIKDAAGILCDTLLHLVCRPPSIAPKIHVLGTLEARLIEADLAILQGLNEGNWPDAPRPSPFLSRGMRKEVGIPDSERQAALSGHDFQQAFLTDRVVLTRAVRDKDGPTLPARWWLRLKAITPPIIWHDMEDRGRIILAQRHALHRPDQLVSVSAPAPTASADTLYQPLSVTSLETWRYDPYSYWAKHIARLKKLDPLFPEISAATKGTVWHDLLKNFVKDFDPHAGNEHNGRLFDQTVDHVLAKHQLPPHRLRLWRARLAGLRDNMIVLENERREMAAPHSLEQDYEGVVDGFKLRAKADRVDKEGDRLTLSDYKTGAVPSMTDVKLGYACQLSLLALIVGKPMAKLEYLQIKGGRVPPKSVELDWDDAFAAETQQGFSAWVRLFVENGQAFVSLADQGGDHHKKAQDYLHLARHQEWGGRA